MEKISIFSPPITNKIPYGEVDLKEVYELIRSDKYKDVTEKLRSIADEDQQKEFKKSHLDFITPAGTFTERNLQGLKSLSHYMSQDIDNLDDEAQLVELRDKLIADEYLNVLLMFRSPRGRGLKFIINCTAENKEEYVKYFIAVQNYIKSTYDVDVDKACKDIARACFLCYDADAYICPDLNKQNLFLIDKWYNNTLTIVTYEKDLLPFYSEFTEYYSYGSEYSDQDMEKVDFHEVQERIKRDADILVKHHVDIAPTEEEYRNLAWALLHAFCPNFEDGFDVFLELSEQWYKPQTYQQIRKYWDRIFSYNSELYKKNHTGIKFPTFFWMAQNAAMERGIDLRDEEDVYPELRDEEPVLLTTSSCLVAHSTNVIQQAIEWIRANYDIRLNTGTHMAELRTKGNQQFYTMNDEDYNELRIQLSFEGIQISRDNLRSIIFSRLFPDYDPYLEFLHALPEYDLQHDYIKDLADIVRCEDQNWWQLCLCKWIVAVVASLADEKIVNQFCPILCSQKQGIGKSTFWRYIIPPELKQYVYEGKINPYDKDSLVYLSSCAFINLDEAESLSKSSVEATKRMITQSDIRVRRAYAQESSLYQRRASFMGSSNETLLLYDSSNRRFGCFKVQSIDLNALHEVDIHLVYAQAYQLYRTGFRYWFNDEEVKLINEHNRSFRVVSFEEEIIKTYLEPCLPDAPGAHQLAAHELLPLLQQKSKNFSICRETIGKTLSRLGFSQRKSNGVRRWIFRFRTSSND